MRERLIQLIRNLDVYNCEECQNCPSFKYNLECDDTCFATKVADYLISNLALDATRAIPAADAVPVVRCKDCKHGELDDPDFPLQYFCKYDGYAWNNAEHFCSYGKRRGDTDG